MVVSLNGRREIEKLGKGVDMGWDLEMYIPIGAMTNCIIGVLGILRRGCWQVKVHVT
jgi:hypothetical protein